MNSATDRMTPEEARDITVLSGNCPACGKLGTVGLAGFVVSNQANTYQCRTCGSTWQIPMAFVREINDLVRSAR